MSLELAKVSWYSERLSGVNVLLFNKMISNLRGYSEQMENPPFFLHDTKRGMSQDDVCWVCKWRVLWQGLESVGDNAHSLARLKCNTLAIDFIHFFFLKKRRQEGDNFYFSRFIRQMLSKLTQSESSFSETCSARKSRVWNSETLRNHKAGFHQRISTSARKNIRNTIEVTFIE